MLWSMYGGSGSGGGGGYSPQPTWSSDPTPNAPGYGAGGGYPQYGPGGPMQQQQQPEQQTGTALKVFGILGISFGGLNLLYNVVSIIQAFVQQRQWARMATETPTTSSGPNPFVSGGGMAEMVDASLKLAVGHGIAMIVMDIAIIVIGILLLQRKEIGRQLAIVWAGMAFIVLIGRAVSFELILMPVMDKFMAGMSKSMGPDSPLGEGFFSMFARLGTYLGLGVMAVWPITLLVAMNVGSVKRSIKPKA